MQINCHTDLIATMLSVAIHIKVGVRMMLNCRSVGWGGVGVGVCSTARQHRHTRTHVHTLTLS